MKVQDKMYVAACISGFRIVDIVGDANLKNAECCRVRWLVQAHTNDIDVIELSLSRSRQSGSRSTNEAGWGVGGFASYHDNCLHVTSISCKLYATSKCSTIEEIYQL